MKTTTMIGGPLNGEMIAIQPTASVVLIPYYTKEGLMVQRYAALADRESGDPEVWALVYDGKNDWEAGVDDFWPEPVPTPWMVRLWRWIARAF